MRPRLARALIVLTVFALLGVLQSTLRYVVEASKPPAPAPQTASAQGTSSAVPSRVIDRKSRPHPPPAATIFLLEFRYYLAWAIVAPGILWLARRVPLRGRRWPIALAFHFALPVACGVPFFWFRILLNTALGAEFPGWTNLLHSPWGVVFALSAVELLPIYWLVLVLGMILQLSREYTANQIRAINLRRSFADAQLDTLKMKLQPHFLFNTLNAIASLAEAGETEAVVRVVERLGTLLRLSMEMSARQFVTLEEELALLDAYLAIEQVRFGDKLHVVRRIAPEARTALVPNLILQPLVDNALVHGLSRRLDASLLEIVARRDGPNLQIAVRDDGPGLPAGWSLAANAGAGLKNVSDRMHGLFAGTCRFDMENGPTGGAVALLSIPFADAETTAMAESA